MRVAALFSGGKDSTYAAHLAESQGFTIDHLVTVFPRRHDSYMFHTVNLHITELLAKSWCKPIISRESSGLKDDELDDLRDLLSELDVDGVVSGAIASNYQRSRIDLVCKDLGLIHISPLWGRNPSILLEEMIQSGMRIMITAVAAMGLDVNWLGRSLDIAAYDELFLLNEKYGVDLCGEGGEYETVVLDAPWLQDEIEILDTEKIWNGISGIYLIKEARLVSLNT